MKSKKAAMLWHKDALYSTEFNRPSLYEVDNNNNPTFSEITDLADREICKKVYEENLKWYHLILVEKEKK